jgi:hypothetical protein
MKKAGPSLVFAAVLLTCGPRVFADSLCGYES